MNDWHEREPRTFTDRELALEREMAQYGEDRARARLSSSKIDGSYALSDPGRAMLRRLVEPVADRIKLWEPGAAGQTDSDWHEAAEMLKRVGHRKAALIGVQETVNKIHEARRTVSVMAAIGLAIAQEWRFMKLHQDNRKVADEVRDRIRGIGASRAIRILTRMGKYHGGLPSMPVNKVRIHAGWVVMDALLLTTDLFKVVNWTKAFHNALRRQCMFLPTEKCIQWVERAEESAVLATPLYLPMVDRPHPWTGPEGGGYLTDLVLHRPVARFRCRAQRRALDSPMADPSLAYRTLNVLQETRWTLNKTVLMVLDGIWNGIGGKAGIPKREDDAYTVIPPDLPDDCEEHKILRRQNSDIHRRNRSRASSRMLCAMSRRVAHRMSKYDAMYFPHRLDFRGRSYPTPAYMHFQGPDYVRGLLKFSESAKMTDEGRNWWLLHGANTWGAKGKIADRIEFARSRLLSVADRIGTDPIDCTEWHDADEPFQFLAWCIEAFENDGYTSLPCCVDASNNGLQLFALMSGDRNLARLTNAIHSDDGPHDLYQTVADMVTSQLQRIASGEMSPEPYMGEKYRENKRERALTRDFAGMWLEILPNGIPREATKKNVMTFTYGVTLYSAQKYVRDWYCKEFGVDGAFGWKPHRPCRILTMLISEAVNKVCSSAVETMNWLRNASGILSKQNMPLSWIAPSGWPVTQHYRGSTLPIIRTMLGGNVKSLAVRVGNELPAPSQQRRGSSPNFVHSVDASVMASALAGWDGPVAGVHDAFATLAPLMPALLDRLRRAVVECVLEAQPLQALRKFTLEQRKIDLGSPPQFGRIEPEEVLASEYLFS